MKKIIIGLFFCLSSQIIFAESNSMLDLKEAKISCTETGGSGTSTASVGDFKIQTSCISGKTNTIFTIKDSQVSKDDFYKQLTSYRQKGDTCTSDLVPSKESVVGSKKFKEVCSSVGAYGTYFIDGKAVETYEVFFNALMAEALSKIPSSDDMQNFGLPCQTATTTIEIYGDRIFKTVCTENDYSKGGYAKYYINNKDTQYKIFIVEQFRAMSEICEEGKSSTTTYKFKNAEFKIVCSGNKGLGVYSINNKVVSFNDFDNAYKAKIDTKESPETSISSNSDSFKSNLTITPPKVTSCLISTKTFKPLGLGMETSNVRAIQERLKTLKYLSATPNGYYGKGTTNAVKAFQKDKKIPTTGTVGLKTLQALNSLCSS